MCQWIFFLHFWLHARNYFLKTKLYIFIWKSDRKSREDQRRKSFILLFILLIDTMVMSGPGWSQGPETPFRHRRWVSGAHVLRLLSIAFQASYQGDGSEVERLNLYNPAYFASYGFIKLNKYLICQGLWNNNLIRVMGICDFVFFCRISSWYIAACLYSKLLQSYNWENHHSNTPCFYCKIR